MLSSPSSAASRPQPIQRVQHNAITMRRQQQRAAAPSSNRAAKQQKPVAKLTLASPYQLPSAQLSLADSLRVLDLIATEVAPQYVEVKREQADNRKKRRREAREESRRAKRSSEPPPAPQPEQASKQRGYRHQSERAALKEDIAQSHLTASAPLSTTAGLTVGLNCCTRALESCQPAASPFALLVLTSCFPPALTAHFTYLSHYLRLPLLTLHPSITTAQFAHSLSLSLTALLALGVHRDSFPSLLSELLPMASVLHVGWLDGQAGYEQLRIDRVERSDERAAREDAKRKAREDAARAARPLSPKSVAAAVFKQKQAEKQAAEAEAVAKEAEQVTAQQAPAEQS